MYVGIGPEQGKKVSREEAFSYAVDRITSSPDEAEEFCREFSGYHGMFWKPADLTAFREDLVEWFYSGSWIRREKDVKAIC